MVILAAFQTLLSRHARQDEVAVGCGIANRHRAEIEGLIGFFVNMLVLRGDLSGGPSFREFLDRVRETALGAFAHQDMPLEWLVEALLPEGDARERSLFRVAFFMQNLPQLDDKPMSGIRVSHLPLERTTSKFDLTLFVSETDGALAGEFEYSTDLFDPPSIARLADQFQTLLASIVADPDQRISTLDLISEQQRQAMLQGWSAAEYPPLGLNTDDDLEESAL
jgi:non-ribosomal peptide synthetase component F